MNTTIKKTAHELTLKFQDASDIPGRVKAGRTASEGKPNADSDVERRFQGHLKAWENTVESILKHHSDDSQAWRFIRITPAIENPIPNSVTLCKDFLDFNSLLIQRRDIDNCSNDELGKLSMLMSACQQELERAINQS